MNTVKKSSAVITALVLLITSLLSLNAYAANNLRYFERGVLTDGTNTAYYIIDKDNRVLYLSGDGVTTARTPDYPSAAEGPFAGRTDVTRIVIEEGVGRIGDYVFANMTAVDTLEIQSNLLSSESNMSTKAMIGCTGLRNIQGDNALLSTNVMLEVIKGAVNIASANWLSLVANGINLIKTGVNGDNSLDDEIVAAMINDYIMTGEEIYLGNLDQTIADYEERVANPCYYNNEYHHNYQHFVTTVPTCTAGGEDMYICQTCNHTYLVPTEALGHSYEQSVMFEPTCTKKGVMEYTCTRCGDSEYHAIPAKGHTEGEWVVAKEPSKTGVGSIELHCAECDGIISTVRYSYTVGINKNTNTVSALKAKYENAAQKIRITRNGTELSSSARVGTGCVITYVSSSDSTKIQEISTVILYGDVNGDGLINSADHSLMYGDAFSDKNDIDKSSVFFTAADMNGDGVIDGFDYFLQDGIISGGRSFDQSVLYK